MNNDVTDLSAMMNLYNQVRGDQMEFINQYLGQNENAAYAKRYAERIFSYLNSLDIKTTLEYQKT